LPFGGGAHIDQAGLVAALHGMGHFLRSGLDAFVGLVGFFQEGQDFVDVGDVVLAGNDAQDVIGFIAAAVAPADVVFAEESALGAGIGIQNFLHGAVFCDLRGWHSLLLEANYHYQT